MGIILNAGFAFFRYILFSIDEYILYEKLDILRKGANFLLLLIVIFDKSFFLFSIFSIAILIVIYYEIFKMLLQKHKIKYTNPFSSFSDTIQLFVFYIKKSKWSFIYNVTHITLHNSGFLILAFVLANKEIIQYGIWQKFAYGVTMVIVAVSDLGLHNTTKHYFENDIYTTLKLFKKTILICIISTIILFCFVLAIQNQLFHYWVNESYKFSFIMFTSLILFFLGRSLQFVSTSLILSFGNNYIKLAIIGISSMVIYHLILLYILLNHALLDYIILLFGLTVIIEGIFYFFIFYNQLNKNLIATKNK